MNINDPVTSEWRAENNILPWGSLKIESIKLAGLLNGSSIHVSSALLAVVRLSYTVGWRTEQPTYV